MLRLVYIKYDNHPDHMSNMFPVSDKYKKKSIILIKSITNWKLSINNKQIENSLTYRSRLALAKIWNKLYAINIGFKLNGGRFFIHFGPALQTKYKYETTMTNDGTGDLIKNRPSDLGSKFVRIVKLLDKN